MKRYSFIIIVALLGAGFVWWLVRTTFPVSRASPPAKTAEGVSGSKASVPSSSATPNLTKSKAELMQAAWDAENNKSLDFYGRVIDQSGDPVPGVEIKAGVGLILGFTRSGGKDYYTETDAEGRFGFVGIHGAGVGFTLTKQGYSYDQRMPSASRPKNHVPNPNNPVTFNMWKLKGADPLVSAKIHTYVPCDGTVTTFDLLTGQKVNNGGIAVTLTRNPVQIVRGQPFDWKATVEFPNGGGWAAIKDAYPNEAPVGGYEPKLTIEMPAKMKGWGAAFERSYYFKSGNMYGRMTVSIQADFQPPPTYFGAEVHINPSGSRNLEFDPAKMIKP